MAKKRRLVLSGVVAGICVLSVTTSALAATGSLKPGRTDLSLTRQGLPPAAGNQAAAEAGADEQAATAANSTKTIPGTAPSPATASGSIEYLRRQYGVSAAEATRRLALQQASTGIAATLAERFPDEYAGMWLDQTAGGVLKIAMTRPEKLGAALTGLADAGHMRVVPAVRSLRQLTETARGVAAALGVTEGADVVIDQPTNSVLVLTGDRVRADDPRLSATLATAGPSARVHRRTGASYEPKACNPLNCPRSPLRGGIRLDVPRDDGSVGGCTTGYNIRSAVTGAYYVLTAGHCVTGGRHTHIDLTWHDYLGAKIPVTVENDGLAENDYLNGKDYAIMPYQPGAVDFWRARPTGTRKPAELPSLVNYRCPGGCAGSHDVRITGLVPLAAVQVGWVVCATGSGYTPKPGEKYVDSGVGAGAGYVPGTRCGEIIDKSSVIGVRICARPGDSGGPLFTEADGKALGILSGGDPGNGLPCSSNVNERNYYAPISTILDRANARTNGTLNLQLVTSGPVAPQRP